MSDEANISKPMTTRAMHEHSPDRADLPGRELLRLARGSIEYGLVELEPLPIDCDELSTALLEPRATFTTLRLDGQLRGCCGTLEAMRPLAEDVTHSAFRAAFRDPRFGPVDSGELCSITLEVSVLSALESIPATGEADLVNQLTPGTDGLVVVADGRRATFLPKVWEMLPDPQHFVAALKAKCGLAGDYWSERLEFQRYRTTCYAESD
ncbi:MAG: AmmeMemoRadiSam system protein A [Gammaproteobacteria bacterium]|nr:AmmeMemoRadiSam system protein A [Gammaproteobacteria bacterium]